MPSTLSHKMGCTVSEADQVACLNDGQCFAVPGGDGYREIACECPSFWTGVRCEEVNFDASLFPKMSVMVIGLVAAGVILLVFLIIFICYLLRRRRERQTQREAVSKHSGTNGKINHNADQTGSDLNITLLSPHHVSFDPSREDVTMSLLQDNVDARVSHSSDKLDLNKQPIETYDNVPSYADDSLVLQNDHVTVTAAATCV